MGHLQPSNKTIAGIAVLLFGAVVFGVGLHHLIATGTCSSTGYSANYGPVPYCPKGTGWWFAFVFGGVFMVVIGAIVSGGSSVLLLVPAIFTAIGVGSLTVAFDSHAASGTKTFGLIFGGVFAAVGLIPALVVGVGSLLSLGREPASAGSPTAPSSASLLGTVPGANAVLASPTTSAFGPAPTSSPFGGSDSQPDAILGAYTASARAMSSPLRPQPAAVTPTSPRGDVLDQISKLSDLHQRGALTDDEFNREKTKLLGEL